MSRGSPPVPQPHLRLHRRRGADAECPGRAIGHWRRRPSRYLFLTDDSGIGNPHAPPAIDCYLVTRLDRLVRRVLDGQISGRRTEPRDGEVIRAVGDYEEGRCMLPPDFRPKEPGGRNNGAGAKHFVGSI